MPGGQGHHGNLHSRKKASSPNYLVILEEEGISGCGKKILKRYRVKCEEGVPREPSSWSKG